MFATVSDVCMERCFGVNMPIDRGDFGCGLNLAGAKLVKGRDGRTETGTLADSRLLSKDSHW